MEAVNLGPAVEVEGLSFRYGRQLVLDGLDLRVESGRVTALVGRNGVGKSTLMRILSGVLPYRSTLGGLGRLVGIGRSRPRVRVLGLDPARNGHAIRSEVGIVADRTDLPRWMTIREHLRFLEAFHPNWDAAEATRRLASFELDPDARYADLSKGQQMLENLVAALAHHPRLLLLDEPFSGLDAFARRRVMEGLIDTLCEGGRSVLLISHSLGDIERCADDVVVLDGGRAVCAATVEELRARTEHGDLEEALVRELEFRRTVLEASA